MNEVTCEEVRESAAEFALGILPADERGRVAAHLLRCPACRREVDDLTGVGDELLQLIPDAEPPPGFDERVLSRLGPDRGRPSRAVHTRRWVGAGVAAIAAAAAAIVGLALADGHSDHPHGVVTALLADGHPIGSVYVEGRPPWLWMTVDHAPLSGPVTCDLVEADGSTRPLGSFDLVAGSGSWAAPEPQGVGKIVGARLVSAGGQTIAVAAFPS
jgi:hypothetical protein